MSKNQNIIKFPNNINFKKAKYIPKEELLYYVFRYFSQRIRKSIRKSNELPTWGPRFKDIDIFRRNHSLIETCAKQWKECTQMAEKELKKIDNLNKEKLRCWRLPLYSPYLSKIKSQVADLSNASLDGMAGSITAALFLQEFLKSPNIPWFHFDTFAWSQDSKGAALQGLDIMSDFLRKNFN